jgi:hypothetical protein
VRLEDLTGEALARHLQPPWAAVAHLPCITLDDSQLAEIQHGRPIAAPDTDREPGASTPREWAAMTPMAELAAIVREKRPGQLWPHRNFL